MFVVEQKTAYVVSISDGSSDGCSFELRSGRQVSRAIDALRRGQAVVIRDGKAAVTVLAVELAEDDTRAALDAAAPADVLITASRAATLKLVNQRARSEERRGGEEGVRSCRSRWEAVH